MSISVFWFFCVSIRLFVIRGRSFLDDFEVVVGGGMGDLCGVLYWVGDYFFNDGFWFWFVIGEWFNLVVWFGCEVLVERR